MKVHSDVSIQMTHGNGTKVTQFTYLTEPWWRALRDDQNGHLDDPIRSPDGKITPPRRSPTRPYQVGRPNLGQPAWILPKNTFHSVSLLWGLTNGPPNTWIHAKSERKTERPHMPLQWAPEMAVRCWDDHPRLDLHLHSRKHNENQCQPFDGS
jgi:hypothetical protein